MMDLRPYQRAAIDATLSYWAAGGGNPLIEMATGTGKSVVIGTLTRELLETYPDMRVLMLVHVRELVQQNAAALLRTWPAAPLGINSAGLGRRDCYAQVLFASIQSVFRKPEILGNRDLVLIDEAHLVPRSGDGMYRTLLEKLRDRVPDLRVAGFTATPYRLDSGRLDVGENRLFDEIAYTYGIAEGVRDGFLSPLVSKATAIEIDVGGVARRGGEFVSGDLERRADDPKVTHAAVEEIVRRGADRRSWLVFATGVKHAHHVREAIQAHGISCETVTGDTPAGERDRIIRDFKAGCIRALTNAMVLTTGFDAPIVDLVALLRPTLSTGLYIQMLGRGTRLSDGKGDCLVLDYGGNIRRHGPIDDVASEEPDRPAPKPTGEAVKPETVRAKVCPGCESHVAVNTVTCQYCGHEWPRPEPQIDREADATPVMASGAPRWIGVDRRCFYVHTKDYEPDKPPSLRVEYWCGLTNHREWVTIEHDGPAGHRAQAWWRAMGGNPLPPQTVAEAIKRQGELDNVRAITIRREGKFWRISGYRVQRRGASGDRRVEINEQLRVRPIGQAPSGEVAA